MVAWDRLGGESAISSAGCGTLVRVMDWSRRLHWDAPYALAIALIAAHPDADVEHVGLDMVYRWVLELPEFDDDPALGHEAILLSILQEWYEEVSA